MNLRGSKDEEDANLKKWVKWRRLLELIDQFLVNNTEENEREILSTIKINLKAGIENRDLSTLTHHVNFEDTSSLSNFVVNVCEIIK